MDAALLDAIRKELPRVKVRACSSRARLPRFRLDAATAPAALTRRARGDGGEDGWRASYWLYPHPPPGAYDAVPGAYDAVHNDECLFSTDTPFAPDGIFVSLSDWRAYNAADVRTRAPAGQHLFLNLKVRCRRLQELAFMWPNLVF
ncbi:hypothetical protein T492DRAFT_874060 [Pavlovales sp. CCMP2436]|nr:hypothetical protein T492DRAFT_874060 [Pavlovales sp. CCMP2436]